MCFSFPSPFFWLSVYISTHAFSSPSSFTIFFSEFFIFLRRCALLFISCNIFLYMFIRIFVFIFYVHFVNFYEWKNCFLSFSPLLRTEGETPNVYWQSYFSSTKRAKEYIEILFSLPFLCVFSFFSHLFAFILSFNLPFSRRLLFPHILNNNFYFFLLKRLWEKSGVISLSFFFRGISLVMNDVIQCNECLYLRRMFLILFDYSHDTLDSFRLKYQNMCSLKRQIYLKRCVVILLSTCCASTPV